MRVTSVLSVSVLALLTTGNAVYANLEDVPSLAVKTASPVPAVHANLDERPTNNVEIAGSTWHASFEEAKLLAQEQGKPILHLQMFGELDDEFC